LVQDQSRFRRPADAEKYRPLAAGRVSPAEGERLEFLDEYLTLGASDRGADLQGRWQIELFSKR